MTFEGTPPQADDRANSFPWPPVLFAGVIGVGWLLTRHFPLTWPGTDDWPARIIGLGFGAAGIALSLAAIVTLRRHGTTVMPDGRSTALVTSGPYVRFRNPIYLGEVLLLLSVAEITKSFWYVAAAALFALLVTRLQILPEERYLERRFGNAYLDYKAHSRRWV